MSNILTEDIDKILARTPESISREEFIVLQEYANYHHQFNIEEAKVDVENGGSIHQAQKIIETNQNQIDEILSYVLSEITPEQLTVLIRKARSGEEEALEKVYGSDLREPKPELSNVYLKVYDRFFQQGFGKTTDLASVHIFVPHGDAIKEYQHHAGTVTEVGHIATK